MFTNITALLYNKKQQSWNITGIYGKYFLFIFLIYRQIVKKLCQNT